MKHFVLIFLGLLVIGLVATLGGVIWMTLLGLVVVAAVLALLRSIQERQEQIEKKLDRLLEKQEPDLH